MSRILTALLRGSAPETCEALKEVIQLIANQLLATNTEYCYHTFVVTVLLQHAAVQELEVQMEQTAGDGRLDVALVDRSNSIAAVLELKRAREVDQLPRIARSGLDQIIHRRYLSWLSPDIRSAQAFGLAFRRHSVSVACQTFERQSGSIGDFASHTPVFEHSMM